MKIPTTNIHIKIGNYDLIKGCKEDPNDQSSAFKQKYHRVRFNENTQTLERELTYNIMYFDSLRKLESEIINLGFIRPQIHNVITENKDVSITSKEFLIFECEVEMTRKEVNYLVQSIDQSDFDFTLTIEDLNELPIDSLTDLNDIE